MFLGNRVYFWNIRCLKKFIPRYACRHEVLIVPKARHFICFSLQEMRDWMFGAIMVDTIGLGLLNSRGRVRHCVMTVWLSSPLSCTLVRLRSVLIHTMASVSGIDAAPSSFDGGHWVVGLTRISRNAMQNVGCWATSPCLPFAYDASYVSLYGKPGFRGTFKPLKFWKRSTRFFVGS